MATTIKLKNSVTTTNTPSSLAQGEVAINITDKKVWVGNAATTPVQIVGAGTTGNAAGSNTQVQYNSSGSFAGSANFTFNGTTVTMANDASISGLTVGKGAGSVATNVVVGGNGSLGGGSQTGTNNTALGDRTLTANTSGSYNTAVGQGTVYLNTTGSNNSGLGSGALQSNTTGGSNTAVGTTALYSNTTASNNTAVGYQAGYTNTTGASSTYMGYQAGYTNNANGNVFVGYTAGRSSTAVGNTFVGYEAGYNSTGTINTFVGYDAGVSMTTGAKNTIIGGYSGNQGGLDIRTASNYIVLSDGDGNPRMYFNGAYPYCIGAYNSTTASAANLVVQASGAFERSTSSIKYKKEVTNAVHGLNELLQLRPVTYKGKGINDGDKVFGGLIAEEVHEAGLTEFVQYAPDGSPDALSYGNMVSLCIKAIQELKAEVDSLKAQLNK